jgi:hypothetical protein
MCAEQPHFHIEIAELPNKYWRTIARLRDSLNAGRIAVDATAFTSAAVWRRQVLQVVVDE